MQKKTYDFVPGIDRETGHPLHIGRDELREKNCHIVGGTRSGKTSFFLAPLIKYLLEPDSTGRVDDVVAICGAGDTATYHGTVAQGEELGREVKPFFSHPALDGYNFDPFQNSTQSLSTAITDACTLIESIGISKSRSYAKQYFWLCSMLNAIAAAKAIRARGQKPSLKALLDYMKDHSKDFRDAEQIMYAIELLLQYPQISSADPGHGKFIRWSDMERENYVPYFYLPGLNEPTATYVATFAVQSLIAHKMEQTLLGRNHRHVHVVWDEYHNAVSSQVGELLAQALKYNISFHLACQDINQLRAVEPTLGDIILSNTSIQVHFTPANLTEEQHIQHFSEEINVLLKNKSFNSNGASVGDREVKETKINHNKILRSAQTRGAAILIRRNQSQFSEPRLLYCEHSIAPEIYQELKSTPLPLRPPTQAPPAPKGWRQGVKDQAFYDREQAISATIDQLDSWLGGA